MFDDNDAVADAVVDVVIDVFVDVVNLSSDG